MFFWSRNQCKAFFYCFPCILKQFGPSGLLLTAVGIGLKKAQMPPWLESSPAGTSWDKKFWGIPLGPESGSNIQEFFLRYGPHQWNKLKWPREKNNENYWFYDSGKQTIGFTIRAKNCWFYISGHQATNEPATDPGSGQHILAWGEKKIVLRFGPPGNANYGFYDSRNGQRQLLLLWFGRKHYPCPKTVKRQTLIHTGALKDLRRALKSSQKGPYKL